MLFSKKKEKHEIAFTKLRDYDYFNENILAAILG